jgi:hypothetical protein
MRLGSGLQPCVHPRRALGASPASGVPRPQRIHRSPCEPALLPSGKSANGYAFFTTPDGLSCMIGSVTRCSGHLPGLPVDRYGDCAVILQTYEESTRSEPFRFEESTVGCPPATDALLDVGQKLTFATNYTTTCGRSGTTHRMHPERPRLRAATIRQLGLLMWLLRCSIILVLGLAACSSSSPPTTPQPPQNFPDLSTFVEETSANFTQSGTGSPTQMKLAVY